MPQPGGPYSGIWYLRNIPQYIQDNAWPELLLGDIGLFAGGGTPSLQNNIEYIYITNTGDSTDFGDLSAIRASGAGMGSTTRGIFAGGDEPSGVVNTIEFVTFTSKSNTSDFGDLTESVGNLGQGASNQTRGLRGGGQQPSGFSNVIDFITMATAGNATDFGDLLSARSNPGGLASPTRAVWGGGMSPNQNNIIEFVTIATAGNSTDFGDLFESRGETGSLSSSTRGVWLGGRTNTPSSGIALNTIDYITIASAGNASDFGDLITAVRGNGCIGSVSNNTRGVKAGGFLAPGFTNSMEYITIATTGNGSDFGDLSYAPFGDMGASNSHGGLQ